VKGEHKRLILACLATLAVLAPLAYFWQQSLLPSAYSVTEMGYVDAGGGPPVGHSSTHGGPGTTSVAELVADPDRPADVRVDLVARKQVYEVDGVEVDGYTLNGRSPGPGIEVTEGELLEVHLRNADVPDGVTLHWHGVDVPNAADGVAGVTQDAVGPGEDHTYRFVADQAGTYWYHSHQVSHEQVIRGLLGSLVVHPHQADRAGTLEVVALSHTYAGISTLNGIQGDDRYVVPPGRRVRVRAINTDNGPVRVWASGPYRVLAVDGTPVHGPTEVVDRSVTLTAGGRLDLEVTTPRDGSAVRVQVGDANAMVVGPTRVTVPHPPEPPQELDLLSYGTPAPIGFDPDDADRRFDYEIGRRPGFVRGRPGLFWTVNGHLYPDLPMFHVRQGEVVRMRIENNSGEVHPMHLHGHHAVVLSRDGKPATGSPWWVDSLNVEDGESYEVAFLADNPGIWMDHCHNLRHAREGLVAHVMYDGVTAPYDLGGAADNEPE